MVEETPQRETTRFHPRSVYGITKVAGFELTRNYREAYNLFTCTGILFNHESPRRGFEFVTRKISSTAARIKLGLQKELRLGNIDAKRDWGFSGEYVQMMHCMLQQKNPEDFVIGTGETHSVREFLQIVFEDLNLNYEDFLVIDQRFYRPAEVEILVADPSKAREKLGWNPKVTFTEIALKMVRYDYDNLKKVNNYESYMLSIITVTYNNFDDLYRTLNSLNKVKGIEKVVVNGGDCLKTKEYLSVFDGIAISEPDKGISDAFNEGVSNANGDNVMFLNSGDILLSPGLSK